jgi:hypothetical protein
MKIITIHLNELIKRGHFMNKKTFLAASIALLFISTSLLPVTAQKTSTQNMEIQETAAVEKFMDEIEHIASESQTYRDFAEKLQNLCLSNDYGKFTIEREFISKMLQFLIKERNVSIGGINIYDLLENFSSKFRPNYFVISYGAYNRLNPRKENSIERFKEGLSMWRYSDASKLLKGRTLILERQPFGIHQKMIGPQLGFMKGFKGIYLDIESKLTGDSYVVFMGFANRIQTFDLTPLSK